MKWFILIMLLSFSALGQDKSLSEGCQGTNPENTFECNKFFIAQLAPLTLPDVCRSTNSQDRATCGMWIVKHQTPDYCQSQKEAEIAKCSKWLLGQQVSTPIQEKNMKALSQLDFCDMSPDQTQITCGDKLYLLAGRINNAMRMNSKMDLKTDKAKPAASKTSTSKAE